VEKKPKILIVDDEERNLRLIEANLIPFGYDVITARDGEEALKKAREKSPDVILLDIMMPGMDGFEVARVLKEEEETRIIPIVMVTALRETQDRIKALEVGADDFLSKPVDKMELKARVKSLLKVKAYHDHMRDYRKELEDQVDKRTKQLKQALEEANRLTEAAQEANIAKSEFLGNMSHEVRTPLNEIMGMTEIILDSDLDPEQKEGLETIKHSSESLLTLINKTLDFADIETGKLELDSVIFNIRECLDNCLENFVKTAREKGIKLICRVSDEIHEKLIGDPPRLSQIIYNLVDNAIKFSEQGEVIVSVAVEAETKNDICLRFDITDSGIGISPEKQKLIFEAFSQADGSLTRKYQGVGLGLTVSSLLVEMMEGKIWVESEIGKGSTFHFQAKFRKTRESYQNLNLTQDKG
jgi:signal transduction histidine kinase